MLFNSQKTSGITFKSRGTLRIFWDTPKNFKNSLHRVMCTQPMLPGIFEAVPAGSQPVQSRNKYPDICELEFVRLPRRPCIPWCIPPAPERHPPWDHHHHTVCNMQAVDVGVNQGKGGVNTCSGHFAWFAWFYRQRYGARA